MSDLGMPYLFFLFIIGIPCFCDGDKVPATLAKCVSPSDVRYTLKLGESKDFRFGQEQSDSDNLLISSSSSSPNDSSIISSSESPAPTSGQCGVSIGACFYCHLKVTFLAMRLPSCYSGRDCRCNYVSLVEPDYAKSRREFCGYQENSSLSYQSKTKLIALEFVYDDPSDSSFIIRVQAIRNMYKFQGHSSNNKANRTGHFESPHFPSRYPSDFTADYQLQNTDPQGLVLIIFTDFQLSPWSFVQVEDSNGSAVRTFNGNVFRPPAVLSSGPNLTVVFKANEEYPNPGFRVKYTFLSYQDTFLLKLPVTECGSDVDDYGGTVSLNVASVDPLQGYDCIWIIKPRITDETHLSLKVTQFQDMGPKSELSIRQGLTSKSDLLETLAAFDRYETNAGPPTQEFVVNVETGFYLRFKGFLTNRSKLAIIYTAFKFESCNPAKDFRCNNGRCIKPRLHCDGFNNCGDGSDEVACYGNVGTLSPEDSTWWRTLTPNYYFPKSEGSGAGGGTNTLILITSLAGLGMFVLTTALILVKLHKQRRDDTATRHMLRTVSADVEASPRLAHNGAGEPPLYDPPPSYEDVIKFYLPPPPTYTSLASSRGHRTTVSAIGLDNSAFVPDTESPVTQQHHGRSVSALPQSLLAVILPSRVLSRSATSLNAAKQNNSNNNNTEAFSLDLSVTEASRSLAYPKRETNIGELLLDLSVPKESPETPPPPYQARIYRVHKCSCQGACSCPSSREDLGENPSGLGEDILRVTDTETDVVFKVLEASTSSEAEASESAVKS